ncbi:MAG: S1C family serine protease [Dehalococcoidia bacterium]|nr:S1C family serine protease [Dehalococcoidia bacterium]
MTKKAIAVLASLLIIIGLLGGYCFILDRQITALTELQVEAERQVSDMQGDIDILKTKMGVLKTDVEGKIGALSTKIEDIPILDAERLYQEVKPAVVEVITKTALAEGRKGSGFVFDSQGYIVTAYHVVENATEVEVILDDGTISSASVTGYCPYSDIAVLKSEQSLTMDELVLGDSNAMAVGEPVIVMGSPFDLSGTVTSGIVSQKGRFIEIEYDRGKRRWVANLIQCDAPVNFGNSGGPLVNSKGEVVGLTVARINPEQGDGIYYAVSSNKLKRVALAIIDHGSFDYPWIGIKIADLTPEKARARNLDTINGALVTEAIAGSVAATAGIRADDIILVIDGFPIGKTADLVSYLGENKSPHESTVLTIIRDGEELELTLELGKRES